MLKDIIENSNYKDLINKQIHDIILFLLDNNQEFSITANITPISFNPALPEDIKSQLHKFSLFVLSNYTYTTIEINEEFLSFEAGFGNENFGSIVKIPLHAVFQIVVDDSILYLNSVATVEKFNNNLEKNSFNIFKNNPNNKKFN
ncbi:hypothetical protein N5915_00545 [Arcobacter lacus]|uniref:Stringent starvation protein B n=1 Tax=Arcobacter lacus TaxID=1912876 RepID=A0ABX5JNI0_9BACT|nr:hypothetical protein [Arcobacter lacus]MCT7908036.1 hypothetical protein [Arcobacter lacus]PUE67800.1 hypothetical protein B0175_02065 [Arcobacter lacus]